MARGDKTGPMGQGPMTGKSLGYCAGYDSPGFTRGFGGGRGQGRGFGGGGRGRGMAYGRGFGFNAGYTNAPQANSNDEVLNLKAQAESLKKAQEEIERRLKDLENN
ncbi:MAG: DUF5320 domain-containing protein [Prolixibacteraceae bacterium]|jgi:hypothetical protein|nr:DUF5320 domain-containing protein [Prolixibacteraceae bacterium]